jgi:hypothetical protein
MTVAGFGDRACPVSLPASVQRGDETDETHQILRSIEARQIAELGDQCRGRQLGHPAMRRQRPDHSGLRPLWDQISDLLIQALDAARRFLDRA